MSATHDIDREWTQEELRTYLATKFKIECAPDEVIPQGVKYVSNEPPTPADIERGKQIAELLRQKGGGQ